MIIDCFFEVGLHNSQLLFASCTGMEEKNEVENEEEKREKK